MKKQRYATLLLALSFFTGSAQSKKLEIGLTGGLHIHNHQIPSDLNLKNHIGLDVAGSLFIRYAINPRWKIGTALLISEWKTQALSGMEEVKVYEASPMLGIDATLTRVLYDFKQWQVSFSLRTGFSRSLKADIPAGFTPYHKEYTLLNGSGFNLGMHVEVSRMLNSSIGIQGSIGPDYYSISRDETSSSYYSAGGKTDQLISIPVQLGVFARL